MNFNIVFRLLILTIRLLKRLSKTNKHIGIKKHLLKKKNIKNIKCIGYFQKGSGLVIRDENKKIIKFNNDGFSHF